MGDMSPLGQNRSNQLFSHQQAEATKESDAKSATITEGPDDVLASLLQDVNQAGKDILSGQKEKAAANSEISSVNKEVSSARNERVSFVDFAMDQSVDPRIIKFLKEALGENKKLVACNPEQATVVYHGGAKAFAARTPEMLLNLSRGGYVYQTKTGEEIEVNKVARNTISAQQFDQIVRVYNAYQKALKANEAGEKVIDFGNEARAHNRDNEAEMSKMAQDRRDMQKRIRQFYSETITENIEQMNRKMAENQKNATKLLNEAQASSKAKHRSLDAEQNNILIIQLKESRDLAKAQDRAGKQIGAEAQNISVSTITGNHTVTAVIMTKDSKIASVQTYVIARSNFETHTPKAPEKGTASHHFTHATPLLKKDTQAA